MAVSAGPREPIAQPDTGAAQRRTATMSLIAAGVLVVLKLGTGLATGSLALVSAGIESSGDVIAALLTLGAIWMAGKPADREHNYGHRRAENIAALGEAAIVFVGGCIIAVEAVKLLIEGGHEVNTGWYVFVVIALAVAIDVTRIVVSLRAARRYRSAAFRSNAFNFAGDLAGSLAVLIGLALVAAGLPAGDAIAALVVACVIFGAVSRLAFENVRALMDYAPPQAREAVARAVADEGVPLRRLRMREVAGHLYVDLTVGVPPAAPTTVGHELADRLERAIGDVAPDADVVVHTEPAMDDAELREQVIATALADADVREVHDVGVYTGAAGRAVITMHIKLDADASLAVAHAAADRVERAVTGLDTMVEAVHTHLEPIETPTRLEPHAVASEEIAAAVAAALGHEASELAVHETGNGGVVFARVTTGDDASLADAHLLAGRVERAIYRRRPDLADVVVHTEPATVQRR
jgi:cation diffusion facilitator family transporter